MSTRMRTGIVLSSVLWVSSLVFSLPVVSDTQISDISWIQSALIVTVMTLSWAISERQERLSSPITRDLFRAVGDFIGLSLVFRLVILTQVSGVVTEYQILGDMNLWIINIEPWIWFVWMGFAGGVGVVFSRVLMLSRGPHLFWMSLWGFLLVWTNTLEIFIRESLGSLMSDPSMWTWTTGIGVSGNGVSALLLVVALVVASQ